MKKVSVIVPVYNVETDLINCIESILKQTYSEWELWLIDDGSTDNSPQLCDEFADKDERIHVIHKTNGGVSSARNIGLDCATGEYVLFVDSDDYLESNAIERLVEAAVQTDADTVLCGFTYRIVGDSSNTENLPDAYFEGTNEELVETCFAEIFGKDLINPPWNKLIKRDMLMQHELKFNLDFSILEDLSFSIQVLGCSRKITILKESLYNYVYKQQNNLVHKFHPNFYEALLYFDDCMQRYQVCTSNEEIDSVRCDFFCRKVLMYLRKIYNFAEYNNKKKFSELKRICSDGRLQQNACKFKLKDRKKRLAYFCIRHRLYRVLHMLYLLT